MADLSDKGCCLLNDLMRAASKGPGEDVNQAFSAALDWVCALESVASAARAMTNSANAQRAIHDRVYAYQLDSELRNALRRLDGAGEGDE